MGYGKMVRSRVRVSAPRRVKEGMLNWLGKDSLGKVIMYLFFPRDC